jgi:GPH family glycoside/pentoside/hexuronide:cation symporter
MLVAILVSALGTHRKIPKLALPPDRARGRGPTLRAMAHTLANRNFAVIAISGLLYGINRGIHDGLQVYLGTYFWGLASEKLIWLSLAALPASFAAAIVAPGLARRWGKKQTCIALFLTAIVLGNLVFLLALLHLMPPAGSAAQVAICSPTGWSSSPSAPRASSSSLQ